MRSEFWLHVVRPWYMPANQQMFLWVRPLVVGYRAARVGNKPLCQQDLAPRQSLQPISLSAEKGFWQVQIKEDDAKDLPRGTRITLHLKEDAKDLADAQKLSNLIKQYSEFIQFPIKLWQSKTEYDQVRQKQWCP